MYTPITNPTLTLTLSLSLTLTLTPTSISKRFVYDPIRDTTVKINDKFEFSFDLDITEFLKMENASDGKTETEKCSEKGLDKDSEKGMRKRTESLISREAIDPPQVTSDGSSKADNMPSRDAKVG